MFQRLLALPPEVKAQHDVSHVVYVVHGAAPCPPEVKAAMIEWFGPVLSEYYAGSEGGAGFEVGGGVRLQHGGGGVPVERGRMACLGVAGPAGREVDDELGGGDEDEAAGAAQHFRKIVVEAGEKGGGVGGRRVELAPPSPGSSR
jgi:acyl-CoA synthetase (AMP-forming)/AMP-acid ligase II